MNNYQSDNASSFAKKWLGNLEPITNDVSIANEITMNTKKQFIIEDIYGIDSDSITDPFLNLTPETVNLLLCIKNKESLPISIDILDDIVIHTLCFNNMVDDLNRLQGKFPHVNFEKANESLIYVPPKNARNC